MEIGKRPEELVVPDGVEGKVEGDAKKIEVSRLRSLCFLLSSCLYYIVFYYFIIIYVGICTYVLITA